MPRLSGVFIVVAVVVAAAAAATVASNSTGTGSGKWFDRILIFQFENHSEDEVQIHRRVLMY